MTRINHHENIEGRRFSIASCDRRKSKAYVYRAPLPLSTMMNVDRSSTDSPTYTVTYHCYPNTSHRLFAIDSISSTATAILTGDPFDPLMTTTYLLLLLSLGTCNSWPWSATNSPKYSLVSSDVSEEGRIQLQKLKETAKRETFLEKLLRIDCHARAVRELETECDELDQESKSRLAFQLTVCQQAIHGNIPASPCLPHKQLRSCLDSLNDRDYQLYTDFLTHTDSICLFLQNQEFEKHTKQMLNRLADGAHFARQQLELLADMSATLAKDTGTILTTSNGLAEDFIKHSESTKLAYESVQKAKEEALTGLDHLATDLAALEYNSQGIKALLDTVVMYQQRSDAALITLIGRSYTMNDIIYYGSFFLAVILSGMSRWTAGARGPLFLLMVLNIAIERFIIEKILSWGELSESGSFSSMNIPGLVGRLSHSSAHVTIYVKGILRKCTPVMAACIFYNAYNHYRRNDIRKLLGLLELQHKERNEELAEATQELRHTLVALNSLVCNPRVTESRI